MIGLDSWIAHEIRAGEIGNLEPLLPAALPRRRISKIEHTAAILAEALFGNTRRECFKLLLWIDHFGFSLESHPCHERRTMEPLALRAVAVSSPKRGKRRFKFHLPAVAAAFSVYHG